MIENFNIETQPVTLEESEFEEAKKSKPLWFIAFTVNEVLLTMNTSATKLHANDFATRRLPIDVLSLD